MAGINKVQGQIRAITSDSSDNNESHAENWSLDVIFASTSPDLLSTNLRERIQIMDSINNRLKKRLAKQAEKLKQITHQQGANNQVQLQPEANQQGSNLQGITRRSPRQLNISPEQDLSGLPPAEKKRLQTTMQY